MRLALFLPFLWLLLPLDASATAYGAPVTESKWVASSTQVECRLSHEIPGYGVAYFLQQAGKTLSFELQPKREITPITRASLTAEAPTWMHESTSGQPYTVYLEKAGRHSAVERLVVDGAVAETMLSELSAGRFPTFIYTTAPISNRLSETHVEISSVNFRTAFELFGDCRSQLLPFSLDEMRSRYLFFAPSSSQPDSIVKDEVNLVADYLAVMEGSSVLISPYSRGGGKKAQALFGQRVVALSSILKGKGIKSAQIKSLFKRQSAGRDSQVMQLILVDPGTLKLLHYRVNSSKINNREKQQLRLLARYIKERLSGARVVINGHTDSRGSHGENNKLSARRAEVVSRFLRSEGIPAKSIRTKAWGERKPVSRNRSRQGRSNNRRVKIDLLN